MSKIVTVGERVYRVQVVDEYILSWFKELSMDEWGRECFYASTTTGLTLINEASIVTELDMNQRMTDDQHFALINVYPSRPIVGERWEIEEETFWYFLEVLPPMRYKRTATGCSFCMSEFQSGNITSQYSEENGRYFHEFVELRPGAKAQHELETYGE